jgi:hypothetical protein
MIARLNINADVGGESMNSTITREADGHVGLGHTLAAAVAGTLSTRTTDTTGTLTLTGHTLANGDVIDVYWSGGRRYNVDVGVVSGDDVPISGGSGDILPAATTAVTAAEQEVLNHADFEGDLLHAIGILCGQRGHVGLYGSGDTEHLPLDLVASELWSWISGGTEANPIAGDTIVELRATQASATATASLKLGTVHDLA